MAPQIAFSVATDGACPSQPSSPSRVNQLTPFAFPTPEPLLQVGPIAPAFAKEYEAAHDVRKPASRVERLDENR